MVSMTRTAWCLVPTTEVVGYIWRETGGGEHMAGKRGGGEKGGERGGERGGGGKKSGERMAGNGWREHIAGKGLAGSGWREHMAEKGWWEKGRLLFYTISYTLGHAYRKTKKICY